MRRGPPTERDVPHGFESTQQAREKIEANMSLVRTFWAYSLQYAQPGEEVDGVDVYEHVWQEVD